MKNQKLLSILCLIVIIISLHGCFCSNRDAEEDGEVDSESKRANKRKSEKFQKLVKRKKDSKNNLEKDAIASKFSDFMALFNDEYFVKIFETVAQDEELAEDLKVFTKRLSEALSEISPEELQKAMKEGDEEIFTKVNNIFKRELEDPKMQKIMEKFIDACTKVFQNYPEVMELLKNYKENKLEEEEEEEINKKEDQYNDSTQEE